MIEIYLKYDNMHIFGMINAFICINNRVNSSTNSMLSEPHEIREFAKQKGDLCPLKIYGERDDIHDR